MSINQILDNISDAAANIDRLVALGREQEAEKARLTDELFTHMKTYLEACKDFLRPENDDLDFSALNFTDADYPLDGIVAGELGNTP